LFDTNKNGYLNLDELTRLFKLFYSFTCFSNKFGENEKKRAKKYTESMVLRIFEKYGADAYPGISLQEFSSLEMEDF
jgi:Ca2+-binding EF-hand superfamily protein